MRVSSTYIFSHVSHSYLSFLLLLSPPSLLFLSRPRLWLCCMMEPLDLEGEQLERVDSVLDTELALNSSGSGIFSVLNTQDFRSTTNSGNLPGAVASESVLSPPLLDPAPSIDIESERAPEGMEVEVTVTRTVREKCVARNTKGVSWGFTSVIGRRREMEDAVSVIPDFMSRTCDHIGGCTATGSKSSTEISPVHFFGVYDGHGGSQVAKFCARRMHDVIVEEWDRGMADGNEWQRRWEAVFVSGFERTDNEILTDAVAPEMVGSTAAVVVLSRCQIITSNCGDSRAVLCRGTQTIPLTVDQKPDRQDELSRIEGGGGKVINWNGARVLGVLAMSRAIGDRYLKPWIIPVPEITFTTRTDEDECLILASDGLWDVMTNEEVAEVARHILRRRRRSLSMEETSPAQVVADSLTKIAYGKNSKDNISIIVVDLKSKRKRHQRPPLVF